MGLIIAVIFTAAMSSTSGEINSLAAVTVIDLYQRHIRRDASDHHYLTASRWATVFWGLFAVGFAQYGRNFGALIEAVNIVGSLFYGGLLGVFMLAFFFKKVGPNGAFFGVLAGEAVIFAACEVHQHRFPLVQRGGLYCGDRHGSAGVAEVRPRRGRSAAVEGFGEDVPDMPCSLYPVSQAGRPSSLSVSRLAIRACEAH